MVEHDVLKLELKKLRNALSVRADEVFSLENRSEQLKMSMEERQKEISVHQCVSLSLRMGAPSAQCRRFIAGKCKGRS